jgi:hypothetical protein
MLGPDVGFDAKAGLLIGTVNSDLSFERLFEIEEILLHIVVLLNFIFFAGSEESQLGFILERKVPMLTGGVD